MKKTTRIIVTAVAVAICAFPLKMMAAAPDWGVADTVESHMVGPGIEYTKIIYHSKPLILWWTVIDLTNPYNKVEQVQSRHQVPDVNRWDVVTHYRENSREGHRVKVAWNHDFFSYDMGICIGNNISNGEMTYTRTGRSLLAITKDKRASVFNPNGMSCYVTAADGTIVDIYQYNRAATVLYGDAVLFNRFNSMTLTDDGLYVKFRAKGEWTVNGADIPCEVLEVSESPLQTTQTDYVLFFRNEKAAAIRGHVKAGDEIKISQKFPTTPWGVAPSDIVNAFHGYPSLAHDGKLHDGEYNDFENGREYETSAHVLAGINKDGTKLYMLINEMSGQSAAVDCVDLTNWMLDRGAWDIVNFDSGGSAAIVVDETMLNIPGRGSVRPVEDAMLAVSLAPDDQVIDHLSFSKPHIAPSTISLTPLRVIGFNKYDNILDKDLSGCTFRCEPSGLGYVDDAGVFHSSSKGMSGKIYAEKDGMTAVMNVDTRTAEGINVPYPDVIVSKKRGYLIGIEGYNGGETFSLDPSAFVWTSSDEEVCSVVDGVAYGHKNGKATLNGTFENLSLVVNVTVEIPENRELEFVPLSDLSAMAPKLSGAKNLTVGSSNLPVGWNDGVVYKFDFTSGRSPYISFDVEKYTYGLPDSITFQMLDKLGVIKNINVVYKTAHKNFETLTFDTSVGADTVYTIDLSALPIEEYPVTVKSVRFNINSAVKGTGLELPMRNFVAHYSEDFGRAESIFEDDEDSRLNLTVDGEILKIDFRSIADTEAKLLIYAMTGQQVALKNVAVQNGENHFEVNVKDISTGFYLVSVDCDGKSVSKKFVIK